MTNEKRQARVFTRNWWAHRRKKLLGEFDKKAYQQAHLDYVTFGTVTNLYLAAKIVYLQKLNKDSRQYDHFLGHILKVSREDYQRFKRYMNDTYELNQHRHNRDKNYPPMTDVQIQLAVKMAERNHHKISKYLGGREFKIVLVKIGPSTNKWENLYIGHFQTFVTKNPTTGKEILVLAISTEFLKSVHTIELQSDIRHAYVRINRQKVMLNAIAHVSLYYDRYLSLRSQHSQLIKDLRPVGPSDIGESQGGPSSEGTR
jgi:hypothetical protein